MKAPTTNIGAMATALLGISLSVSLAACSSSAQPSKTATAPEKPVAGSKGSSPTMVASSASPEGGTAEASAADIPDPIGLEASVRGYVDKRARVGESRNRRRTAVPFDIEKLPQAVVPAAFKDTEAPKKLEGEWAKEVVAKKQDYNSYGYGYGYAYSTVSVSTDGFTAGSLRIGAAQAPFYAMNGTQYGGLSILCGPNEPIQAIRWEGFLAKKSDSGDSMYQIVDGWFDRKACKAVSVRRQTIKLKTIVADTLYAFRECETAACEGRPTASFVIPYATAALTQNGGAIASNMNAATRIAVSVRKGGSESILATTYRSQVGAYYARTLGVEIIQGTADEKPFATAFIEDPK
ncbi:MAG: hypothetical protein HOW73_17015 [Polyangiaceae bacterium]|nr:hypothetical protein [Polyangiaceae bacterium]